jgi:hypothetical protein
MITYTWIFSAFDCKVDKDGMQNVITTIHWRYKGTDEDGVSVERYGAHSLPSPTPSTFIPYSNLSKEQVIEWMEETMDIESMNLNITQQIELIKYPVYVTLSPPFTNQPTSSII